MKNRIFNENIMAMCWNCLKFTIQHKTIICFGLIMFLFKSQNIFSNKLVTILSDHLDNFNTKCNKAQRTEKGCPRFSGNSEEQIYYFQRHTRY